jgi:hypothetical protein
MVRLNPPAQPPFVDASTAIFFNPQHFAHSFGVTVRHARNLGELHLSLQ